MPPIGPHTDLVKVKVVCASCKEVVGYKLFDKGQEGKITHCLCKKCIRVLYGDQPWFKDEEVK